MKEEDLNSIMWRTRFGRGYDPVARQKKLYIYWVFQEEW